MTNDYITKKVFRSYLVMSIAAMAAVTLGMLIDGIVVGNFLGSKAMAAFGLCSPLFIIFAAVAGVFSNGSISLCAKYIGQDKPEKVNEVFTGTMITSVLTAGAVTAVCVMFPEAISRLLGANDALLGLTKDYILGFGIGAVPIIISQVLIAFARTDGSPSISLISIVGMAIANISLDFIMVLVFDMGMVGMGLATSISYFIALMICCSHFLKKTNTLRLVKPSKGLLQIGTVLKTGMPNAVNRVCITLRTAILNNVLGAIAGSVAITALSIQSSLNSLLGSVCLGVGTTALLICGIFFGEEDKRTLADTVKVSIKTGIIITTVISVITIVAAKPLVMMFGKGDADVIAMATRTIIFFMISLPLYVISVVFLNYYQSTGNLFMANFVCIGDNLIFMLIPVAILVPFMGTDGVWLSFILCELIMLISLAFMIKLKTKKWPRCLEDFLLLPDDFGISEDNQITISIGNDMKQVLQLSEGVKEFCTEHNIDARRTHHLSLCIEEMAGNVVKYAFKSGEKHYIDICIMIKDSDLIFRMRDDGVMFNPLERLKSVDENDKCSNIGIRLVKNISKTTDYRNTVGLNNLIIRI